jgi:zinc transport system permease protein
LIYLILVATIALGIKEVGTLLVGALVIVPAAAAKNFSSNLSRYCLMSAIFGLARATLGVFISSYVSLPAGPLVVMVGAAIFIAGVVISAVSKRLKNKVPPQHRYVNPNK